MTTEDPEGVVVAFCLGTSLPSAYSSAPADSAPADSAPAGSASASAAKHLAIVDVAKHFVDWPPVEKNFAGSDWSALCLYQDKYRELRSDSSEVSILTSSFLFS